MNKISFGNVECRGKVGGTAVCYLRRRWSGMFAGLESAQIRMPVDGLVKPRCANSTMNSCCFKQASIVVGNVSGIEIHSEAMFKQGSSHRGAVLGHP